MVPTFANEILYQITETAKLGNREYEVSIYSYNKRYVVCEEIASELRLSSVSVIIKISNIPIVYDYTGSEFKKPFNILYLYCSW